MTLNELNTWRQRARKALAVRLGEAPPSEGASTSRREVLVCAGGACVSCGNASVASAFQEEIGKRGMSEHVKVVETGCVGCCDLGVVVQIMPEGVLYRKVTAAAVPEIVEKHLKQGEVVAPLLHRRDDHSEPYRSAAEMPFFKQQVKIVLENSGLIDPQVIDEYVARDGYQALAKTLHEMKPEDVVREVMVSGLRGRGG